MFEVLRVVLAILVVGSLVTLAVYAVAFVGIAFWTVAEARRHPTLADELEAVLADILRA
ncbi:MAG TPA: hypothetical protein VIM49_12960 [Dermatophilaceae bacterium]